MNEVYKIENFRDDEIQQARAAADAVRDISREQKLNPEVIAEAKDLLGNSIAASDSGGLSLVSRPAEEPKPKVDERKPPKPRPRRREHAKRRNRTQMVQVRHDAQRAKQNFSRR